MNDVATPENTEAGQARAARPLNPYVVLLASILLPGSGYVLCGQPKRGFTMQMFMIALAFVTWHLAPETASFAGKLAGGLFVYALTLPESYRLARMRWVACRQPQIEAGA
jgi:hypothetical protein